MITYTERPARIGELLRVRGLIMVGHEEQLERVDDRLQALYPADFLAVVSQAEAQSQEPPDFLIWYTQQEVDAQGSPSGSELRHH